MGRMEMPLVFRRSTRNWERPSCFLSGTTWVRNSEMAKSERCALLVQILVPFTL